jgi:hypothetical protein
MLKIYNELLTINYPIGTSFVFGFQLSNKNEFILCLFEIPLVDPLTLTIVLSLFYPCLIFSSLSHLKVFFNINIIL